MSRARFGLGDRIADAESFFTADRDVGVILGALTLTATQVSAGTLVGAVGLHYVLGVGFVWSWVGIWVGWLAALLFVGPQLRARGGYTVSDFLAARFRDDYESVRGLSALLIAVVYLVFVTAQYVAGGVLLRGMFGLDTFTAAVLLAVVALSYTAVGGMRSSVYTDAVQVLLMLAGILVAVSMELARFGGVGDLFARAASVDPSLVAPVNAPVQVAGFAVAFGLGIVVAPFELSRMYAMRDAATVRRSIPLAVAVQVVIAAGVALLGLAARVQFRSLATPDAAVVRLILDLFGPVAGGLLLLAVLAAILSTVDSVLVVTAAAVAHDLYGEMLPALGLVDGAPGDRDVLAVARATTVAVALVPVAFAVAPGVLGGLVQVIVALYSALLAGALLVPVVAGLYWPGATAEGALAGMVAGPLGVAAWHLLTLPAAPLAAYAALDPVVPGVALSAALTATVSLLAGG